MLDKNFVKPLDNNHYNLNEAVDLVNKYPNNNIGIRLIPNEPVPMEHVIISKEEIDNDFEFKNLPAWQYFSNDWEVVVPDKEKMNRVN